VPAGDAALERQLGRLLQVGTYVAIALVALGTMLLLATGTSPLAGVPPIDPGQVVSDLLAFRPAGFLWAGIVVVISLPSLRVLASVVGYARQGERRMLAVGILVLLVLAVGAIVGVMAR
jgi:uncharacterized membrane protein